MCVAADGEAHPCRPTLGISQLPPLERPVAPVIVDAAAAGKILASSKKLV
jgi:hypothetical protein